MVFETDEESGSKDLLWWLDQKKNLIKNPDLIVCLDSGVVDWKHFCVTSTLRGVLEFRLSVEVAKKSYHSGLAGGIIPDPFRIARKLIKSLQNKDNQQLIDEL